MSTKNSDPVREQIERDSEQWRKMPTAPAREYPVNFNDIDDIKDAHIVGRLDQDPIAWNRCLDDIISFINKVGPFYVLNPVTVQYECVQPDLIEELEKLRR